jgi:Fe-S cluster biogenesis protein NfuA
MTPETPAKNNPKKTDGQTDNYQEIEEYFKNKIGYYQMADACRGCDTSTMELMDEILLNILDMYYSEYTTVNKDRKPQAIIRSVLSKLDYWRITQVMEQYKSVTNPIKNVRGYLQTAIYNSVFEHMAKGENFKKSYNQE